ncbi:hypothetical protein LCGC14_1900250 [marine sediment metagenome]|uniref:Uncharacterized protein n=1 Tax=marine sediment metagenome TaxID=412755 RepID=A0A0F9IAR1_9ZZZZ
MKDRIAREQFSEERDNRRFEDAGLQNQINRIYKYLYQPGLSYLSTGPPTIPTQLRDINERIDRILEHLGLEEINVPAKESKIKLIVKPNTGPTVEGKYDEGF